MNYEKIDATTICQVFRNNGFQGVFAGGCVRDQLLGIEPNDYDIATNATPNEIKKIFPNAIGVGKNFGIMLVHIGESKCEVATFRTDGAYSDGRRPDSVSFATMKEDAERRDFTINAIFYDPVSEVYHDFKNGKLDIINKVLRFVGDPYKRIQEDHLRIMRAIRFAVKYDLKIDHLTECALREHADLINNLPKERIVQEFNKILELGKPTKSIRMLLEYGIIDYIIPLVRKLDGNKQDPIWHPEGSLVRRKVYVS